MAPPGILHRSKSGARNGKPTSLQPQVTWDGGVGLVGTAQQSPHILTPSCMTNIPPLPPHPPPANEESANGGCGSAMADAGETTARARWVSRVATRHRDAAPPEVGQAAAVPAWVGAVGVAKWGSPTKVTPPPPSSRKGPGRATSILAAWPAKGWAGAGGARGFATRCWGSPENPHPRLHAHTRPTPSNNVAP